MIKTINFNGMYISSIKLQFIACGQDQLVKRFNASERKQLRDEQQSDKKLFDIAVDSTEMKFALVVADQFDTGKIIKQGGTSNQILFANRDTIDKDKLDYEPTENARYSAIAYGMYELRSCGTLKTQNSRVYISMLMTHSDPNTECNTGCTLFLIVDNALKPKFSGKPSNIPLNAFIQATKQDDQQQIVWTNVVAIDCYINTNGNEIINTECQFWLPDDFAIQVFDSYVIHNQSAN
ncbi:MAG: hypothetical protein EZS28_017774 [Streblomastix strix]|uniref:Uncharacterized protein n=1 Tax=Streblomastix strix TaxID=222440 RepID=A0A5J4VVZ9_9EUKA|nr:MAG: hypothetical protein EZS28_017774 [Streblomastix strix]